MMRRASFIAVVALSGVSCSRMADPVSCTDTEVLPVTFGNFPGGPIELGQYFMWSRGKGWFRVEEGCRFTMWYGDSFVKSDQMELDTAPSKPRAGILSE